jgi:hypothetical protein
VRFMNCSCSLRSIDRYVTVRRGMFDMGFLS